MANEKVRYFTHMLSLLSQQWQDGLQVFRLNWFEGHKTTASLSSLPEKKKAKGLKLSTLK